MRRACFPSVARHLSAGTARLVDMLVDKRAIPQFISSPLPDLGTKLVDLSVQFPWAMGTNGAEKLGLAGRSGGRPTSYWAASPKGVRSGPWRPRFWTTTRVGLGHFSRYGWYGRARIPLSPTTTSVSASRSRPHRARELRRRRAHLACSPARLDLQWLSMAHHVPCTLSPGGESWRQLAPGLRPESQGGHAREAAQEALLACAPVHANWEALSPRPWQW